MSETSAAPLPAEWCASDLVKRHPDSNNRLLVLALQRHCGCSVKIASRPIYRNGQFERSVSHRAEVIGGDVHMAQQLIEASWAPAPREQLIKAIAVLWETTSRARASDSDVELKFRAYVNRLHEYPADVALHVIQKWGGKWFPALSELVDRADALVADRAALRKAVM